MKKVPTGETMVASWTRQRGAKDTQLCPPQSRSQDPSGCEAGYGAAGGGKDEWMNGWIGMDCADGRMDSGAAMFVVVKMSHLGAPG
jgi:hypothetical protein